jgi:hypothetical protein
MEVELRAFLTSILDGVEYLISRPGRFYSQGRTPVPAEFEAGWVAEQGWSVLDKSEISCS